MNEDRHALDWRAVDSWPKKVLMEAIDTAIPAGAIQRAIQDANAAGQRLRLLPARVCVLQILAMCLWSTVCMRDCLRNLIEGCRSGLGRLEHELPGKSAICAARKRLGVRPLSLLFKEIARPLATAQTKGAFYKSMRLVAFDGTTINTPDTEDNDRAFGRPGSDRGRAAFPKVRLVSLIEVATRVTLDFAAMPYRCGEHTIVVRLLRSLQRDMLVLWDRGFHSYKLWRRIQATGAQVLARVQIGLIFTPVERLRDGSFLAYLYPTPASRKKKRHGILVRIITYTINDPKRPEHREKHRLITTLLDDKLYPAKDLICLYHERWEIEIGYDEIKVHQNQNRTVLRSKTPWGVMQEIHGMMLTHFALCHLRHQAALANDIDPDRISFVHTVRVVQRAIPAFQRAPARLLPLLHKQMLREIAEEILPVRRIRYYPRVVKKKMSKFALKRDKHKHIKQPSQPFADVVLMP